MWQILLASWKSGLRSRYFQGVIFLAFLIIITAYLASSFSPRQPRTVAMDIGFSGIRISLVLLGLFWVQEMLARDIDRRTVLTLLSYPISRGAYLVGRFLGIVSLGLAAGIALGLALMIAVVASGFHYEAQLYRPSLGATYWLTLFGLWVDSVVVVAFTLSVATISSTPMIPLAAGAGFAIAGKSLGAAFEYVVVQGGDRSLTATHRAALELVQWLIPDLSRLDWRYWPLYHTSIDMPAILLSLASALAYVCGLLVVAMWAFGRREFS